MARLNVSSGAGGSVTVRRNHFDHHVNSCDRCLSGALCDTAQTLWRNVVVTAMRARQGQNAGA